LIWSLQKIYILSLMIVVMKKVGFLLLVLVSLSFVFAMTPPCTEKELINSSDFAIKGIVLSEDCGGPYVSYERDGCEERNRKCEYKIGVLESLKGEYSVGNIIEYESDAFYDYSSEGCKDKLARTGDSGFKELEVGSYIEYYPGAKTFAYVPNGVDCNNFIEEVSKTERKRLEEIRRTENFNSSKEYQKGGNENKSQRGGEVKNNSNDIKKGVKIMPEVASERALERLRLKNCYGNCTIELKEVGSGNKTREAYEVQIERHSRILGIFSRKMNVEVDVDADTGDILEVRKPWWAFLASEPDETEEE